MEPPASDVLTVWERGLRQSLGERALSLLALADEPLESPGDLPAGARDAALLRIRRRLAGERIDAVVDCQTCGEQLDVTLAVADLLAEPHARAPAGASIALEGYRVDARLPTSADLATLRDCVEIETGARRLLQRCTLLALHEGEPVEVDDLPEHVLAALDAALAAADPGGDTTLAVACPACGAENRPLFDIPTILWSEIQQLARNTMLDVHELARAYGWDERAVLSLSPARRRFYLEAVGT